MTTWFFTDSLRFPPWVIPSLLLRSAQTSKTQATDPTTRPSPRGPCSSERGRPAAKLKPGSGSTTHIGCGCAEAVSLHTGTSAGPRLRPGPPRASPHSFPTPPAPPIYSQPTEPQKSQRPGHKYQKLCLITRFKQKQAETANGNFRN